MFRLSSRRIAAAAAIASCSVLLAACSSGSGSGSADKADTSGTAPTGVTLTMWHNASDSQALLDLYKAYEKASGNTIDLVSLPGDTYPNAVQTKWATGDRPDILEYMRSPQDMRQLNMTQNMVDLSSMSFVKAEGSLKDVAGTLNGKTYGAVLGPVSTFGVYYNKKVLAAAGLKAPTNYSELASDCSALKSAGKTTVAVGGGSEFPSMMIPGFTYMGDYNANDAWGDSIASGKAKVTDSSDPLLAGLKTLASLKSNGCLNKDAATANFQTAEKAVYSGSAAFTVLPSDMIADFYKLGSSASAVDATVGFGPISAKKGVASYAPGSYGTYYVPKTGDSTKQRAAEDFIDWVTTKGYQTYINDAKLPTTLSTATTPKLTGMYASMASMLSAPTSVVAFNNVVPGFGNFGKICVKVLAGQDTAQKAASEFQTFIDQARAAQQ